MRFHGIWFYFFTKFHVFPWQTEPTPKALSRCFLNTFLDKPLLELHGPNSVLGFTSDSRFTPAKQAHRVGCAFARLCCQKSEQNALGKVSVAGNTGIGRVGALVLEVWEEGQLFYLKYWVFMALITIACKYLAYINGLIFNLSP